jgi:broad specificity phosphatase PhoE
VTDLRPTLYFIRHGETDWNAEARLQGQRDVPLNAVGRVQAEEVAARLRGLVPGYGELDYVASPLGRARDTMERLRAAIDLPANCYRLDSRLMELSFGSWEGLTWREIRARESNMTTVRARDKWTFVPPGGESYAMLVDRVAPAVADLTRDTVIVSHGGVARVLLHLLGNVPPHLASSAPVWQGKVLVFRPDGHEWA